MFAFFFDVSLFGDLSSGKDSFLYDSLFKLKPASGRIHGQVLISKNGFDYGKLL
jgi:hypothetical protein